MQSPSPVWCHQHLSLGVQWLHFSTTGESDVIQFCVSNSNKAAQRCSCCRKSDQQSFNWPVLQIILWYLPDWEPSKESSRCVISWRPCREKTLTMFLAARTCRVNGLRLVSFCVCIFQYHSGEFWDYLTPLCPPRRFRPPMLQVWVRTTTSHWQTWSLWLPCQQACLKLRLRSVWISLLGWWALLTGECCSLLHSWS